MDSVYAEVLRVANEAVQLVGCDNLVGTIVDCDSAHAAADECNRLGSLATDEDTWNSYALYRARDCCRSAGSYHAFDDELARFFRRGVEGLHLRILSDAKESLDDIKSCQNRKPATKGSQ